jgi:virginiamycin B lyase
MNIIPTFNSNPYGITMAPDGTIWFTENNKGINKIGSFTPTTNGKVEIQEHLIIGTRPHLITADQQGNIWFTLGFSGTIGRYNPGDDTAIAIKVTDCLGDACTHTSGIAADQKGKIWFTDSRSQHIGYYSPSENKVVNTKLESKDPAFKDIHPHDGLVVDSYGTVWFTEQYRRALVMAPGGRIPK